MKNTLLALALVFPALACTETETQPSKESSDTGAPAAVAEAEHAVGCGCKNEDINRCGNYVIIGEEWLEISNPADYGLNKMEWCAEDGTKVATVAGTRTGDKIELTTLEVAEN